MASRDKIAGMVCCVVFACACAGSPTPEQARAKIESRGVAFDEAGFAAAIGTADNDLLELFLIAGYDPNRGGKKKVPAPLALAASRSNLAAVKMLIDAGARVADVPGILGPPAARGDVAMLRALLDAGADVDSLDHLKQTALVNAVTRGRDPAVRFLLDHGADPDRGKPLLASIKLNLFATTELLVQAGADVNILGGAPLTTPLSLAARMGQDATVEFLLAHGADPAHTISGWNAARSARSAGHEELAQRIERATSN